MVYTGKPSTGCNTCRKRRIKCDEGRPTCNQCMKSKRECLGYRDTSKFVFRDETVSTGERIERRARIKSVTQSWKPGSNINYFYFDTVPKSPRSNFEQEALDFFVSQYVLLPRHLESVRGYLEFFVPVIRTAKEDSAIHSAIAATSLATLSHKKGSPELFARSRISYAKACAELKTAVADPTESRSNATLMTVLLLTMYDTTATSKATIFQWGYHADGAAAIVRHRGQKEMLSHPVSRALYWSVMGQSLINQIIKFEPMDPFLDWTDIWSQTIPGESEEFVGNRLTAMGTRLPALRFAAMRWMKEPMTSKALVRILHLKANAVKLDEYLASWPTLLPDSWRYSEAGTFEGADDDVESWPFWPGAYHGYYDLWVCHVWNRYRTLRILCNYIILNSIERLHSARDLADLSEYHEAKATIQQLVDEICAAIPFALGHPTPLFDAAESVVYTSYEDIANGPRGGSTQKPSAKHHRTAAQSLGGWMLSWPLFIALQCLVIPHRQRVWIKAQLQKIGSEHGIGHASMLGMFGSKPEGSERGMTLVDMDPPPFTPLPDIENDMNSWAADKSGESRSWKDSHEAKGYRRWGKIFESRMAEIDDSTPLWDGKVRELQDLVDPSYDKIKNGVGLLNLGFENNT